MTNSSLTLREAVKRFRREPGAHGNAYDWYRKHAQREGRVSFGDRRQLCPGRTDVRAAKVSATWVVDAAEFARAIEEHRAALAERERITQDYSNHVLHGQPGATIYTVFGGYSVYPNFHRSWNSSVPPWKGGGDWWTCNHCWGTPSLEHDKPECHTCSDWGRCGRDCTLSRVSCGRCGSSMAM